MMSTSCSNAGSIHRMHPHRDAGSAVTSHRVGSRLRPVGNGHHHVGVVFFTADRSAILAVQRDIEHAGAEFFRHLSLQRQTLEHPRFHATVMVAHRQRSRCCLGAKENIARMPHGEHCHPGPDPGPQ